MLLSVIMGLGKYQATLAIMNATLCPQLKVVFGGNLFQFHNGVQAIHIQWKLFV